MEPNNEFVAAARDGNIKAVGQFLDDGVHPDTPNVAGATALDLAASNEHADIAFLLIDRNASPDHDSNEPYTTALIHAATNGDDPLVERLLKAGANPNLRDNGYEQTALIWAAAYGRSIRVVELLLEFGADPGITDCYGNTALVLAREFGFDEIARLIESHPKPDRE